VTDYCEVQNDFGFSNILVTTEFSKLYSKLDFPHSEHVGPSVVKFVHEDSRITLQEACILLLVFMIVTAILTR
jgi:hypothetical protein